MFLAFGISAGLTPLTMLLSRKLNILDVPKDDRRMHDVPIPLLGGAAIAVSFFVVLFLCKGTVLDKYIWALFAPDAQENLMPIVAGGIIMYIVGVVDDKLDLPAWVKLLSQIGCATLAFFLGVQIPAVKLLKWHFEAGSAVSFIITVIWIVAITNMINLTDGLDGLAAGVGGIAAMAIGYSAYITGLYTAAFAMVILAGAALGFLPFNFYPAKVFMGDGGAMFIGFMLASISIIGPAKGATIMSVIAPVLVLGVPVFDIAFAMVRRLIRGKSIFSADSGHIHHQLLKIGMGQRRAVMMLYGICGVMGMAAVVFSRGLVFEAIMLCVIAIVFIVVLIWGWNHKE